MYTYSTQTKRQRAGMTYSTSMSIAVLSILWQIFYYLFLVNCTTLAIGAKKFKARSRQISCRKFHRSVEKSATAPRPSQLST